METQSEEFAAASRKPYHLVLYSGLLTSAVTLFVVYWCGARLDFQPMGWYANYVIPIGAILVGMAAGSGYGLASWLSGVRISQRLLLAVLFLQTLSYFAAEYVQYRDAVAEIANQGIALDRPISFLKYYDFKARSFAWAPKHGNGPGNPLGGWGYVFVLLGAAGFILSGLVAPAVLATVPYCAACQRYMSTQELGVLPASVPVKKIKKGDQAAQEAHEREQQEAAARGEAALARILQAAAADNALDIRQEIQAAGPAKDCLKLPQRIHVSLVWCKTCSVGHLSPTVITQAEGQMAQVVLVPAPASAKLVQTLLERA